MNALATGTRPSNLRMVGPHMFAAMRKMPLARAFPILAAPTLEAALAMLVGHVYETSTRVAGRTQEVQSGVGCLPHNEVVIAWLLPSTGDGSASDDPAVAVIHLSPRDPAQWAKNATGNPVGRPGWRPWRWPWRWWSHWWTRFNVRMSQQTLLDIVMHGARVADFTMQEYLSTPEDGSPVAQWMRDHLIVGLWHDRQVAAGADPQAVQTMIALRGWPLPAPLPADLSDGSAV